MSLDYCIQQVREYDYESYVTILFMPRKQQPALWVVHAFRVELMRVKSLIREPMMGLIRFQWWRDSIEKLYDNDVLRHEVLTSLADIIPAHAIAKADLLALIDSYEQDLETDHYHAADEIYEAASKKSSPFLHIICSIIGQNALNENELTVGKADLLSDQLLNDSRIAPYKELIKIDIIRLISSASLSSKKSFFGLRLLLAKRRLKAFEAKQPLSKATLAFHLWLKSL